MPDSCSGGSDAREAGSRLVIPADALSVRQLSGWLTGLLAQTGTEATALHTRVELAVHEVCMNIVDHAYGPEHPPGPDDLRVDGSVDAEAIRIEVRDHGAGFDFRAAPKPEQGGPHIRGYGLVIVEKLVDELSYVRRADTNIWSLRFDRIPDPQGTRP